MEGADATDDAGSFLDDLLSVYDAVDEGRRADTDDQAEFDGASVEDDEVELGDELDEELAAEYVESDEFDGESVEDDEVELGDELVDEEIELVDEEIEPEPELDAELADAFDDDGIEVAPSESVPESDESDLAGTPETAAPGYLVEDPEFVGADELENLGDDRHEDVFEAELMQSLQHEEPTIETPIVAAASSTFAGTVAAETTEPTPEKTAPDAEALDGKLWPVEPTWLDEPSPEISEALAIQSGVRTLRSEPVSRTTGQVPEVAAGKPSREINASIVIGATLLIVAIVLGVLLVLT